ncbi:MAG: Ig-like domain-containing protein, partial [Candidatus Edwardsbacteria bacterium]|nr:Ig-like domain-containing protein [Candidatus Edwardsbacteria bacterium]
LINDPTPVLDYSDIADAWRYRVQVCRDSAFAAPELDTTMAARACTLLTALGDGRHWWRARARDLAGNWAPWSDSTWFRLDPPFDSSAIDRYLYKKGGPPQSAYDTSGYGQAWSAPINGMTADGSGVTPFYLWARDAAGNVGHATAARVDLRYDSIPPKGARAYANEFSRTTSFTVSWGGASDQGGSGLSGRYWIKQKVNGGSWTDLNTSYAGTSYVYSGSQGNKYYFEVAALDSAVNNEAFAGVPECSTMVDNTITSPILVSPYNGAVRDSAATTFRWQRATAQAGSRLQCSYNAAFTAIAKDTVLAADSAVVLTLADSLYYWRAQGRNSPTDTSAWTPARALRIDTQAPAAPVLASPAADSLVNDNTPQFAWGATVGATRYRLQVAADTAFTTPQVDQTVDSTVYTAEVTLQDSAWHWRVRAGDAAGNWSAWSARRAFTVDTRAPAVPAALSPAEGATVTTNLPQFRWNASAGATRYQLQVSVNTSFSPNELDSSLADTALVPQWGIGDGVRYWRLRCRDAAGNWSAWNAHRTMTVSGILRVALATPAAGAVWTPSTALWIQFSKPLNTGYIDTNRVKVRGRYAGIVPQADLVWQAASRTLMVAPDSSFAANDTVTVLLHGGLRDSNGVSYLDGDGNGTAAGDSTDNYQMTFYTTHIGDYNRDRAVGAVDLMLFTLAWYSPFDRFYEAGPYGGAWPHQRIWIGNTTGSTKLDFEDAMGLIHSWDRAAKAPLPGKGGAAGPVALALSADGAALAASCDPALAVRAMDATLRSGDGLALGDPEPSAMWRHEGLPGLFLAKRQGGDLLISAASWPGAAGDGSLFAVPVSSGAGGDRTATLDYRLYDGAGAEVASGSVSCAVSGAPGLPPSFALGRAAPNPALRRATISYQLPAASPVRLEVYNITGQRVATLVDAAQPAGYYARDWDLTDDGGRRVGAGVYFYKLAAGTHHSIGKLTVVR